MKLPAPVIALCALAMLGACSYSRMPKLIVAHPGMAMNGTADIRDENLAASLAGAVAGLRHSNEAYNAAVELFVVGLQRRVSPHDWKSPLRISGKQGVWELWFEDRQSHQQGREWPPAVFDRITPSRAFRMEHYRTRVAGRGIGVPVVLAIDGDMTQVRKARSFRADNGIYVPGTAILEFPRPTSPGAATPARLRIFNTVKERQIHFAGARRDIAFDHTSAVEANLDNDYIRTNGLRGLLRPDKRQSDLGLFALAEYDPGKIPVVFVHGLNSSPRIWAQAVNELFADAELRERYQPLLFIYPTGMSIPGSAARFRESLMRYRAYWDPESKDANFDRMVIVGHSMGGLLTRLQIIDTGEELRKAFFTKPIAENDWLNDEQKHAMHARLVLKPLPFVSRAVFIAVPHRGSLVADIGLVRLAVRLIKLPIQTTSVITRALTTDGLQLLNPGLLRYNSLGMRGVDMLSADHPYFKALEKCAIATPFHSIIGDRGQGFGSDSSDGIVPYWSSHLDKAQSELIVPHGHSCTMAPETVNEVLRILRLHLKD